MSRLLNSLQTAWTWRFSLFVDRMCVVVTCVTMSVWLTHLLPREAWCE